MTDKKPNGNVTRHMAEQNHEAIKELKAEVKEFHNCVDRRFSKQEKWLWGISALIILLIFGGDSIAQAILKYLVGGG